MRNLAPSASLRGPPADRNRPCRSRKMRVIYARIEIRFVSADHFRGTPPAANSSMCETALRCRKQALRREDDQGLAQPRRSAPPCICRRSRWKYCAGVVQLHTCMLSSAQSCRKRSMRALECSGPWPS